MVSRKSGELAKAREEYVQAMYRATHPQKIRVYVYHIDEDSTPFFEKALNIALEHDLGRKEIEEPAEKLVDLYANKAKTAAEGTVISYNHSRELYRKAGEVAKHLPEEQRNRIHKRIELALQIVATRAEEKLQKERENEALLLRLDENSQ
jgi:hypothetical protein